MHLALIIVIPICGQSEEIQSKSFSPSMIIFYFARRFRGLFWKAARIGKFSYTILRLLGFSDIGT
jgi:hypothetical protein